MKALHVWITVEKRQDSHSFRFPLEMRQPQENCCKQSESPLLQVQLGLAGCANISGLVSPSCFQSDITEEMVPEICKCKKRNLSIFNIHCFLLSNGLEQSREIQLKEQKCAASVSSDEGSPSCRSITNTVSECRKDKKKKKMPDKQGQLRQASQGAQLDPPFK